MVNCQLLMKNRIGDLRDRSIYFLCILCILSVYSVGCTFNEGRKGTDEKFTGEGKKSYENF